MQTKHLTIIVMLLLALTVVPLAFAQEGGDDAPATEEAMPAATEEAMMTEEPAPAATEEATPEPAADEPEEDAPESVTITAGGTTTYVIQPGDTLFSIANRFGTTVTALAELNDIVNPSRIFWGQTLLIPGEGGTGGPNPPGEDLTVYNVREGDNLYRIALRYNTTVTRLMELNDITNPNLIFIGQELIVPRSA